MQKYELLYIVPAKHTDDEVTKLAEKISGLLTAAGASISESRQLGKMRLAYPIQHTRYGHYVLVNFEAETPVIIKLNDMLRLSTDILRHLIVKRDPKITKAPRLINFDEITAAATRDEEPMKTMAAPRPVAQPKVENQVIMADLDKKLDEILQEEVR